MIVLDTDVVFELVRPRPDPAVVNWVDGHPAGEVHLTSITAAELQYGVARLPGGPRKSELAEVVGAMLHEDFAGRIVVFDHHAARIYADIVAWRERDGRPMGMADAQIAAICASRGATLATRNVKDFPAPASASSTPGGRARRLRR